MNAWDALTEIFTWVGFGIGALLAGLALVLYLFDGTWVPARAVVEHTGTDTGTDTGTGALVRWFDEDGEVNEAPLGHADLRHVGERDMADIFTRRGWRNRMRFTRGSPAVRAVVLFAAGFLALGAAAAVTSLVMLLTAG